MNFKSSRFDILLDDDQTEHFQLSSTILKRQYEQLRILMEQKKQELNQCHQIIKVLSMNSMKLSKKLMETNELYLQIANKYEKSQKRVEQLSAKLQKANKQNEKKDEKMTILDNLLTKKTTTLAQLEVQVARREMSQQQLSFKCAQLFKKIKELEQDSDSCKQLYKSKNAELENIISTSRKHILQMSVSQLSFSATIQKIGLLDQQQNKVLYKKIQELKENKDSSFITHLLLLKQWLEKKNSFVLTTYGVMP